MPFFKKLSHEKLAQNTHSRHPKPFIDKDLQLQLPEWESNDQTSRRTIYSHFIGSHSLSSFLTEVNEEELHRAMKEAELSFKGWHQMQQQLKEVAQMKGVFTQKN